MKKILTLLMLGGVALAANAQQINGDFDGDWKDCVPWTSDGNTTIVSAQPEGWHISNVCVRKSIAVGSAVKGSNNTRQAVHLTNQSKKIPAYLTLGTPWATAQVKCLWYDVKGNSTDGGTWGGINFTYHPDAIAYEYKRDNSKGDENATVIAYLWKGTWTQKDVPGNPTWHAVWYVDPTYVDMNDRERNVLGMQMQGSLGGEVTHTNDAKLLASLQKYITNSTKGEWVSDTIPFDYKDMTSGVEKLNVIFSAADYFGGRNNIVDGNSLTVDNVRFIYYHALDTLATTDSEGKAIALNEKFAADRYNYTVNAMYDANKTKVPYTKKGVAAMVDTKYDEATRVFSIIVKGEDYDAVNNPSAISTYTIKYKKPAPTLTSLVVAGKEFISAGKDDKNFTANGKYNADEVSYKTSSETAKVNTSYDKVTGKLTITVEDEESMTNVYTITFNGKEKVAFYQIPNADFENWGETALAETWNSFESATGKYASFASFSPMPEKIDGFEGYGVRIKSKDLGLAYANGNITTGRINMGDTNPADVSNYNFTDLNDINGSLPFTGTPDAFEVYARFAPGTAKNEGTVLQGRVQLIVHGEVAYHDPELSEQAANKIASASVLIPATADWTKFTGEFNYTGNESDNLYLLASATTNPVPGASKDDQLDLDNIKLIYYHALSNLTFNGVKLAGFSADKTDYTITIDGDVAEAADKIKYVVKGRGASATTDLEGDVLTITVNGNDYAANAESQTVYTVKFEKKVVDGINSISADYAKNHKVYTLSGVRVNGKPAAGVYIVDGKKVVIK